MAKKKKVWSYSHGEYHARVRVYESRGKGSLIHAEIGRKKQSLGHRDRARARQWAIDTSHRLALKQDIGQRQAPRVDYVLALYLEHRSPQHTAAEQKHDQRSAELWTRVLGAKTNLTEINVETWDSIAEQRLRGAIDAYGKPVESSRRREVRPRTVEADQQWLRQVILWAMKRKIGGGKRLLSENPLDGFEIMADPNPRRPVATTSRYETTRAVSDQVRMDVWREGKRTTTRSHLSEILDLIHHTGRRLSSVLSLRFADLRPEGIHWRAESDKKDKEWNVPINLGARAALDRIMAERPGVGEAFLFPSTHNPRRHVSRDVARRWLLRAERLAELPRLDGSLWHAYRRGWVTSRKHLPDVDVAEAGGWTDLATMQRAYQQPDTATLLRVVNEPMELREAKG